MYASLIIFILLMDFGISSLPVEYTPKEPLMDEGSIIPTENEPQDRLYMVIDLSAGPSVQSYPISYLNQVPAEGWRDEYKTSKMVLRLILPGTYQAGASEDEVYWSFQNEWIREKPRTVVIEKPFYLAVFETTQRQWELVMGTRPSYFRNEWYYMTRPVENISYHDIRGAEDVANWPKNSNVGAESFIGRLRAKTGIMGIDIPTEYQWEYACRAGTETPYNDGLIISRDAIRDGDGVIAHIARYYDNTPYVDLFKPPEDKRILLFSYQVRERKMKTEHAPPDVNGTEKVGSYQPNKWGLYDMHGNVEEWCRDWYERIIGSGDISSSERVLRGGSWVVIAEYCRSSCRKSCWAGGKYRSLYYRGVRIGVFEDF